MKKTIFCVLFLLLIFATMAQDADSLKVKFNELSKTVEGLNETVDLDVGKTSVQTFIAALGKSHNLNVSISPQLNMPITANFANETVKNVLLYLVVQYNLEVKFIGSILYFSKKEPLIIADTLNIQYNKQNQLLSFDLDKADLQKAIKSIVNLSGENIILAPLAKGKKVDGFVKDLDLKSALEKLAYANNLELAKMEDSTFLLKIKEQKKNPISNQSIQNRTKNQQNKSFIQGVELAINQGINGETFIDLSAMNKPISDIIKTIFQKTGDNYIFFTEPDENTTVSVKNVAVDELLSFLLNTTEFTYKKENDVYLFGLRSNEKIRNTQIIKLKYRALEDIKAIIPSSISEGVKIDEFPELNALILSGSAPNIQEVKKLIEELDQTVPVIMTELIIVDINKTRDLKSGIKMGLSDEPVKTSGTLLPGLDVTLSSSSINSFLNLIGLANLGKVTPNFYVSLSLLEANGNIKIQSTPRLSTLNSHEATLSIGETSYYLEQQQNVIGTQNPQTVLTNQYKSVNADFSITLKPILSGDEHITMEIDVNQSQFTGRIATDAPPGQTNRQFKSIIRVKNEEMIVLGGLDREEKSETGEGLPWIARVPILNWFFGNKRKIKNKSKLIIFIKPTIIY